MSGTVVVRSVGNRVLVIPSTEDAGAHTRTFNSYTEAAEFIATGDFTVHDEEHFKKKVAKENPHVSIPDHPELPSLDDEEKEDVEEDGDEGEPEGEDPGEAERHEPEPEKKLPEPDDGFRGILKKLTKKGKTKK